MVPNAGKIDNIESESLTNFYEVRGQFRIPCDET